MKLPHKTETGGFKRPNLLFQRRNVHTAAVSGQQHIFGGAHGAGQHLVIRHVVNNLGRCVGGIAAVSALVRAQAHRHTHVHAYAYAYAHAHVHTHAHMRARPRRLIHARTHARTHAHRMKHTSANHTTPHTSPNVGHRHAIQGFKATQRRGVVATSLAILRAMRRENSSKRTKPPSLASATWKRARGSSMCAPPSSTQPVGVGDTYVKFYSTSRRQAAHGQH